MSWLFGGAKKKSEGKSSSRTPEGGNKFDGATPTYETGRNVDSIVSTLLMSMNDPNQEVVKQIQSSIQEIGKREPLLLLSKGLKGLIKLRGNKDHKVLIMDQLKILIDENEVDLPDDLCHTLVRFCIAEVISEKSISSMWQNSAEQLLISLAKYNPKIVSQHLFSHFETNQIPHYFIIKSLADFSHRFPEHFYPFVKEVLAKTLPLLANIKGNNIKWVVSAALGRFAENIVIQMKKDNEISTAEYSGSFNTAVRHLLDHWILKEREKKVRLSACESLGFMVHLVEKDHLQELLPKLFIVYQKELKKEANPRGNLFAVANGLKNIIFVVMRDIAEQLEPFVDQLLLSIHSNACFNVRNLAYKNREETEMALMQSFEYMGQKCFYTDKLVSFLAKYYDSPNSPVRVATLRILTHLISALTEELRSFKETIVSSINIMAQQPDYSVQLELVKLVCKMAEVGYLNVQGGTDLVNMVVRSASITNEEIAKFDLICQKKKKKPALTPSMLRDEADKVLVKLVSKEFSKNMDSILYPFILEDFIKKEYQGGFTMLCHCLSTIAKRKKQDDDFLIDFEKSMNLPQPHVLLARLFVMLCTPYERNESGTNILRAMYCLSPNIRDTLVEVWSRKLQEMKKYLDSHNKESYEKDAWANLVLNLVRDTINAVDEDEWNVQLGEALKDQHRMYDGHPELKKNLLSIYGLVIQKTKYRDFIHKAIDDIILITNHTREDERVGCARGMGQAATTHTDTVLTKLQQIMKSKESSSDNYGKKNASFKVTHYTKATALLSYGYVCMLTPIGLIDSRVEVHVVNNILPVLKVHKSSIIKELGLKSLDLVAKAVHPSRLKDFKLRSRNDVVKVMLGVIKPIPKKKKKEEMNFFSKLKVLGLEGLVRMIHLPPELDNEVLDLVISELFLLFKLNFGEFDHTVTTHIHKVMSAILQSNVCEETLDKMLLGLENYIGSPIEMERIKSTEAYIYILKEFVGAIKTKKKTAPSKEKKEENEEEEKKEEKEEKKEEKEKEEEVKKKEGIIGFGRILANFIPRLTETNVVVRENAYNCIYLAMRIQHFLKTGKTDLPEHIKQFKTMNKIIKTQETKEIKRIIKIIQVVYSKGVEENNIVELIDFLLETLDDVEIDGARGSCVVLNGIIRSRGKELKPIVEKLVVRVMEKMKKLEGHEKLVRGLLYSLRELAHHHLYLVLNSLLKLPVPHTKEAKESLQIIASDKKLNIKILDYFLDIINNGQLYDEVKGTIKKEKRKKGKKSSKKKETGKKSGPQKMVECNPINLAVTYSMFEILEVEEFVQIATQNYTKILPSCLLRIGAAHYTDVSPPVEQSIKILENFLKLVKDEEVLYEINKKELWTKLKDRDTFTEGVLFLMRAVCDEHNAYIKKMFDFIQPFNTRVHLGHRIAAGCIISVLLDSVRNDKEMIQVAINELLRKTGLEEDTTVKLYSLRGLAGIVHHPKEILHTYVAPVSNALINCIEDKEEEIVLETMESVAKVFSVAEDQYVSGLLINLCIRLKPSFEKDNEKIRAASIKLFGTISRFCKGSLGQLLINNVHNFIPTIIVHLQDTDDNVKESCKESLLKLIPELGSSRLVQIFKNYDDYEEFDQFAEDFAKVFVSDFPSHVSDFVMNIVLFFKSKWDDIIIASVLITGYIFFYIGEKSRQHVNLRHTVNGFLELLKNRNPKIRQKVSKVLGNLYTC